MLTNSKKNKSLILDSRKRSDFLDSDSRENLLY